MAHEPVGQQLDPHAHQETALRVQCPRCGSPDVRRASSDGTIPSLLQMFGRRPFRCRSCRSRFFRFAPPEKDE